MKTSRALAAIILIASITHFSCQKDINGSISDPNSPHPVTIFLTDHQTLLFDSVFVDLQGVDIKLEDDSLSNGGWVSLNIRPGVYNILRFRNGLDTLFATGTLPNARIRKIRLTLGTQNSVMKAGVRSPLRIKDEDRQVIAEISNENFEISQSGQVFFWIDFDASRSIQEDNSGPGNGNGYRLRSHITIFSRGHSGSIEGKLLPRAANPLAMAIKGTDTTVAIPEDHDGEYKIVGLSAGVYRVLFTGQNGYIDTTINNVNVRAGEDTHIQTVVLHR